MELQQKETVNINRFSRWQKNLIGWLLTYGSKMIYVFIAFVALLFISINLFGRNSRSSLSDFIKTKEMELSLSSTTESKEISAEGLAKNLNRYPELQGKIGAMLAQYFLDSKDNKNAEPYMNATFKRVFSKPSHFAQFSQTTYLICKEDYVLALEEAKKLKKQMLDDTSLWKCKNTAVQSGALLYLYNLLRIAVLEKKTGTPQGEFLAWEELLQATNFGNSYDSTSGICDAESCVLLQKNFQQDDLTLLDYIEHRRKVLASCL
jgi:hypothetical protein